MAWQLGSDLPARPPPTWRADLFSDPRPCQAFDGGLVPNTGLYASFRFKRLA